MISEIAKLIDVVDMNQPQATPGARPASFLFPLLQSPPGCPRSTTCDRDLKPLLEVRLAAVLGQEGQEHAFQLPSSGDGSGTYPANVHGYGASVFVNFESAKTRA